MADPLSIVGGVGSIIQIISSVTKLAKNLNEVRESYNTVALNTTLVASQLSTIRAALEALHTWRSSDTVETEASKQLDNDLGLSLNCCAILITVIDKKLDESGYKPGAGIRQKINYMWLEDILKEYVSNLEGQVRALQLLLTIFQCRTATEQKQELSKQASRTIIEQVRAETMSLSVGDSEMDDAISILSQDPSVHFDVDSILMGTPAYERVYGKVRKLWEFDPLPAADTCSLQRESPRRKKGSKPPPPPPPRRKPAHKSPSPPPISRTESVLSSPSSKPLPQPPSQSPTQQLVLSECRLPSPAVSPSKKPPSHARLRTKSEQQRPSQERINVWDYVGSGKDQETYDAQVFELPAETVTEDPNVALEHETPTLFHTNSTPEVVTHQRVKTQPSLNPVDTSPAKSTSASIKGEASRSEFGSQEDAYASSRGLTSLEGFETQLNLAFEENAPVEANAAGLRLSLGSRKASRTSVICKESLGISRDDYHQPEAEIHASSGASDYMAKEDSRDDVHVISKTFSIHSDVDLYDASVRNVPLEEESRPASQVSEKQKNIEILSTAAVIADAGADMGNPSASSQNLAAEHSDSQAHGESSTPKYEAGVEMPGDTSDRFSSTQGDGSQSVMSLLQEDIDRADSTSTSLSAKASATPLPPSRAPPVPPALAVSLPPNSPSSAPSGDLGSRNSGFETSTASSGRDSSVFEVASTISSSEQSTHGTLATAQQSTPSTTVTSVSIDGETLARTQAQSHLRRLHGELKAAKARGDSQAFQNSLQKSIEVINYTYLARTPIEYKKPPILKDRVTSRRFPSITGSSHAAAICDAAANGDATSVKALLDTRANVDARGKAFMTPLMLAAMSGHTECMALLKRYGADEFAVDAKGRSVLHLAIASKQVSVVQWLINAYPSQRPQQLKHRSSILSKAADSLRARPPKSLLETSDAEGSKPMHVAVVVEQPDILKILLAAGAVIESKNNWSQTPLHQAIISYQCNAFDVLLQNGASVNAGDARSMSPLHWAAKTGRVDMIQALMTKGANRVEYDSNGLLPLHQAAWVGKIACIQALRTEPKDLEIPTKAGETLLHIACLTKNSELATYLLDNSIEVNPWAVPQSTLRDSLSKFKVPLTSLTPLHYACCRGDLERAMLLLEHEAWVNAATPEGVTALMMAAESEDTNTVNLLLSRGAKVNASMPGSLLTALHISSRRGDLETVQQLCRAGANRFARTSGSGSGPGRAPIEEAGSKCTDRHKKILVQEYFRTIRQNELNNKPRRIPGGGQQSYETVGQGYRTAPSLDIRPMESISYAPWGQHNVISRQDGQYGYQQEMPATYPFVTQPTTPHQWYDPNPLTHFESPPPYQPSSNMSARLAAQAPVHRSGNNSGL
ncbi:hypothetical protein ACLMJK_002276 [Lecanora helva]